MTTQPFLRKRSCKQDGVAGGEGRICKYFFSSFTMRLVRGVVKGWFGFTGRSVHDHVSQPFRTPTFIA